MVSFNPDKFSQDALKDYEFANNSCFIPIKDFTTDELEFKIKHNKK